MARPGLLGCRTCSRWRPGTKPSASGDRPDSICLSGGQALEMPVFEVRDQHILVTGGSSGFGRHFAQFLAGNGAKVTLAARVPTPWPPLLPRSTHPAARRKALYPPQTDGLRVHFVSSGWPLLTASSNFPGCYEASASSWSNVNRLRPGVRRTYSGTFANAKALEFIAQPIWNSECECAGTTDSLKGRRATGTQRLHS